MDRVLDVLLGWGRLGGVILLLVALALFGLVFFDYSTTGSFFMVVPGLATGLMVPALILLVMGKPRDRSLSANLEDPHEPSLALPELVAEMASRARPFWVCTHCRMITGPGVCLTCNQSSTVYSVMDDEDFRMVLTSLG
ncbi:MAG: hypothetical protein ACJAZO_003745 [Myxococcota bacterium]|jgi:hypothetical protein